MRWLLAKSGDTRKRCKFLWFPKTINYDRRWLCVEVWEQVYDGWLWYDVRWLD